MILMWRRTQRNPSIQLPSAKPRIPTNEIRECVGLSEYSIKQYVDKLSSDELVEVSKKTRGWE
eukprot:4520666-Amphidinium_carterae.1